MYNKRYGDNSPYLIKIFNMVEYNKLYILPCDKGLYLDCSVLSLPYFKDVYIDKVIIDTQNTFSEHGISTSPIYQKVIEGNVKDLQLLIDRNELLVPSMRGVMFFVYVVTKGNPSPDTPCGCDIPVSLGVAVDSFLVYKKAMKYLWDLNESCSIPKYFIDFILFYRAFQLCLKTRNFLLAIKYWDRLVKHNIKDSGNKCLCNGRVTI